MCAIKSAAKSILTGFVGMPFRLASLLVLLPVIVAFAAALLFDSLRTRESGHFYVPDRLDRFAGKMLDLAYAISEKRKGVLARIEA